MATKKKEKEEQQVIIEYKSNSHGLIIFFLLLIAICLGLYICYYKGLLDIKPENSITTTQNRTKAKNKEEKKIEILEVTSNDVRHLFNTITSGLGESCGIWNYFTDVKVTSSDISNELASAIALKSLYNNGIAIDRKSTVFTENQLDTEIKKIFGSSYEYTHKDIDICPGYTYDSNTKTYTPGSGECGGVCNVPNVAKIVKAYKEKNDIVIYVRVLFSDLNNSVPTVFYKDVNKTRPVSTEQAKATNYNISDETFAEGSLYKMAFTLENGNYVFKYSEPTTN